MTSAEPHVLSVSSLEDYNLYTQILIIQGRSSGQSSVPNFEHVFEL